MQGVVCVHPGLLGYGYSMNHNSATNHSKATTTSTSASSDGSSAVVVQSFPSHECYLHRESSSSGGDGANGGRSSGAGGDDDASTPVCLVIRPKVSPTTTTAATTATSAGTIRSANEMSPLELVDQPGVLVLRPAQKIRVSITARYDMTHPLYRTITSPPNTDTAFHPCLSQF